VPPTSRRLRAALVWLGLAVTVVFAYLAVRGVDFGKAWHAFRASNGLWAIPMLAVLAAAVFVRGVRWRSLFPRGERPPLEGAQERHAGNAARFDPQRRRAPARELRQLLAVPRNQRLVGRDHRDAAIECAAHERIRGLDTAEHFDDDVDRLREERVRAVGEMVHQRRCRADRRRGAHERRGHERGDAARRQIGGGLTRQARERRSDIAKPQQADPACRRQTWGIYSGARGIDHGRYHDKTLRRDAAAALQFGRSTARDTTPSCCSTARS